ncbi:hypothetical protein E1292_25805 [Nonomuraea deserti]|uniref:Uncharacterized protein n=1 Tax=Nonomuraea deserti TaxID=1848322 RepID=A0A4V2Y9X7_9ACTN|nr:hypothetical protein [Nonomuraea deserti]TDD01516.1 hypothetical protein E1292_25805 [Nonomuraea deserti]
MFVYCRAYRLGELRAFEGWADSAASAQLSDDEIVYLTDEFTVLRSPVVADEAPIRADDTPEWREFCASVVNFQPDDHDPADDFHPAGANGGSARADR